MIEGVQYVTNPAGEPVAVQIDLQRHGSLWEDFCDIIIAEERKKETHSSWEDVKKRLNKKSAPK